MNTYCMPDRKMTMGYFQTPKNTKMQSGAAQALIRAMVEVVASELGVQKRLYNYMTFELGLQVLVSYPQTADKGTGVQSQEGMKVAWKPRASGTSNSRKQLPDSNRDDCEGLRNMNGGDPP